MKGTMKKTIARIVAVAMLSITLATGAQIANAAPSHALTWSSPWKHQVGGTAKYCPVYMRVTSINFWDWLAGYRVGQIHLQYYALC